MPTPALLVARRVKLNVPDCEGVPLTKPLAFMDIGKDFPKHLGFDAVRRLRDVLTKRKGDVYVQHDHRFPSAEKLLRAIGFKPTGEWRRDMQNTGRHLQVWHRPPTGE